MRVLVLHFNLVDFAKEMISNFECMRQGGEDLKTSSIVGLTKGRHSGPPSPRKKNRVSLDLSIGHKEARTQQKVVFGA